MSSPVFYRFFNSLDKPKRYFSLTMDELVVACLSLMLLIVSSQRILVAIAGFGLVTLLRRLKKNAGPKALLVLAYWYLPKTITQFFLPKLPASHCRIWVA